MVDIRQTVQYANYLEKIGWVVEKSGEINYFIKKLPLVGSIIKVQRPEEIRINKIRQLSKKYHAFQIIIEPKTEFDAKYLSSLGFRLTKSPYLPTKTLQLDLTKSREALWRNLEKDAKSAILEKIGSEPDFYNYKKLIKSEAIDVVKTGKNQQNTIGLFREGWKRAVKWKRYVPPFSHLLALKKLFKENSLFLVTPNYSSGTIFLIGDKIGYYWQAFTNKEGRKILAQYKIIWEGILWAKKMGARIFDFEGIYDERFPNKSWLGFTHFKKSFGGYEVAYPGTFVKWFL
ncbi:MAG: Methicillin resistance protein [Candidatus Woesebacteria bacterium GW2011_GWE1_45_18]|uniref:Methicillin resistance protein n=1 Tax=Candidatus Woesebacteria bacterium GW2011_GWE1_45_18 TaxID=1618598 RepID=A0A0G1M414_9BACT|nr:MAG: Methicillin resistance protein [Candidatus Woesebacteria bacterium GW2011_GWE1_45_18]